MGLRFASPATVTLRSPTVVQVGLDPGRGLLLPDAPAGADAALRAVAAGCTAGRAALELGADDRSWLPEALAMLADAGLLTAEPRAPRRVAVVGTGPLADACRRLLRAVGGRVVAPPAPTPTGDAGVPVLVATDRVEPARHLLQDLLAAHRPHLVVRAERERAVVGPFVDVGRSPCTRCLDLVRTDLDPRWPHVLAQLCRMESLTDAATAAWVAATAVAQVRAWWAGRPPETVGTTIELDAATHRLEARRWPHHPQCGCRWTSGG